MSATNPDDDELRRIYADTKAIAVVGASSDPSKPGHEIPRYLQGQGYRFATVSGRQETYRADVNYGNGIRLLGSNLSVNSRDGHGRRIAAYRARVARGMCRL